MGVPTVRILIQFVTHSFFKRPQNGLRKNLLITNDLLIGKKSVVSVSLKQEKPLTNGSGRWSLIWYPCSAGQRPPGHSCNTNLVYKKTSISNQNRRVSYSRGPRTSACFCAKARLMGVGFSPRRQTNMRKLRLSCFKKGKFETLKGFGRLKTYLQAWEIIVSNSKRKISSSSLGKTTNLSLIRNWPK